MAELQPHNTELPLDIILFEILPKLPISCLRRFKCVCKQWRSFLSSREITTFMYPKNIIRTPDPKLIIVDCPPWTAFRSLDCNALRGNKSNNLEPITSCPFDVPSYHSITVLASLDGLVCVAMLETGELVLWNPLTNVYKKLPQSVSHGFYYSSDAIGLYTDDSSVHDYKVLHVNSPWAYNIYSRRLDSWRSVQLQKNKDHLISTFKKWSPGTFFRGSLYFTVKDKSSIIGFDVKAEKFREIIYPSVYDSCDPKGFCGNLVVVKGCLHLCVGADNNKIDMWWMVDDDDDNDNDKCKWIKVVAYSGIQQQMPLRWTFRYVMWNGKCLVIWEHMKSADSHEDFTWDELCLYSAASSLRGVLYVESLVTPNP